MKITLTRLPRIFGAEAMALTADWILLHPSRKDDAALIAHEITGRTYSKSAKIARPATCANTSGPLTNQRRNRIMAKADLTAQRLRELLDYDPETGVFTWVRPKCSRVKVGDVAGSKMANGYWHIGVGGSQSYAHRLAWLYVHGHWPLKAIDHINGNRLDNRICNLREASAHVNGQNQRRPKKSKKIAAPLGVHWDANARKWQAQIRVDGKSKYIGIYATPEEAHDAYLERKRALHPGCTL